MELITVFSAFNVVEADLVRSRLEVAEFHPVVTHGLSALSMDGYSLATGGILVQVPDAEAEEARAFLAEPQVPPVE
jgi:putative signal transducing protein